ncbi:hypothetical protein N2152v2_002872 [Parachlorella kessleri]
MSKLKKQQKKKRWSEVGVSCPAWYCSKVEQLAVSKAASSELRSFGEQLKAFLELRSTYGELESLKKICPLVVEAAEASLAEGSPSAQDVHSMLSTLAELLFLENSRPLHRQLLALLRPLPEPFGTALGAVICSRVDQLAQQTLPSDWAEGGCDVGPDKQGADVAPAGPAADVAGLQSPVATQSAQDSSSKGDGAGRAGSPTAALAALPETPAVPLGQALTSLLGLPAMRPFLGAAAAPAVASVVLSIKGVLSGVTAGAAGSGSADGVVEGGGPAALHIPPGVMEDVQDAVSALYYMLTAYSHELAGSQEGRRAVLLAADALLVALKGSVLARETLALTNRDL